MPIKLNSASGGSVTLDVPATASTFTHTFPAETGTVITTATGSGINASAMSVGTLPINRFRTGQVLQTAKYVYDSYVGQLNWSGLTSWQAYTTSDTTVTALKANSMWSVMFNITMAGRSYGAVSIDMWYSVNGGSFNTLSGQSTSAGADTGSYGLGTIWTNAGSSDTWMGSAFCAVNTISHSAGDSIKFRIYGRSGGPGTDVSGAAQAVGHPYYNGTMLIQEIAQ